MPGKKAKRIDWFIRIYFGAAIAASFLAAIAVSVNVVGWFHLTDAAAVVKANGKKCRVRVRAVYMEGLPSETYEFGGDYDD